MTNFDKVTNKLKELYKGSSFTVGQVLTINGGVVPHLFVLYNTNVYLTTNPKITKYKGSKVYYYLDYNKEMY